VQEVQKNLLGGERGDREGENAGNGCVFMPGGGGDLTEKKVARGRTRMRSPLQEKKKSLKSVGN